MIGFGPVPSRRLGRSLGINNIPAKVCSYSCVYCQLGKTIKVSVERQNFYPCDFVFEQIRRKVKEVEEKREHIDYLTFVPDGEPTLDVNLGKEIDLLKSLGIKIAVITNGSLIYRDDVKNDLAKADLVSLKVDAVTEDIWHRIDRPDKALKHEEIKEGMLKFTRMFKKILITETMFTAGLNDDEEEIKNIAEFLGELNPARVYIATPTRPPAEDWVKPIDERSANSAYQIFSKYISEDKLEYLMCYEGNAFTLTNSVEETLLSTTSVHPMRVEAVKELLNKSKVYDWNIVKRLIDEKKLIELEYEGHKFYMRRIPGRQ